MLLPAFFWGERYRRKSIQILGYHYLKLSFWAVCVCVCRDELRWVVVHLLVWVFLMTRKWVRKWWWFAPEYDELLDIWTVCWNRETWWWLMIFCCYKHWLLAMLMKLGLMVTWFVFVQVFSTIQEKIAHVGTTNKIHLTCSDDPIFSYNCSVDTESFGKCFFSSSNRSAEISGRTQQILSSETIHSNATVQFFSNGKNTKPQMTMEWV